jgi:hypothetical protein
MKRNFYKTSSSSSSRKKGFVLSISTLRRVNQQRRQRILQEAHVPAVVVNNTPSTAVDVINTPSSTEQQDEAEVLDSTIEEDILPPLSSRELLIVAVRILRVSGLESFLKSSVGGKLKSDNLNTCLSRTVSLAQYAYEKVELLFISSYCRFDHP